MLLLKKLIFLIMSLVLMSGSIVVEFGLSVLNLNSSNIRLDVIVLMMFGFLFNHFPGIIVLYAVGLARDVLFSMPLGMTSLSYAIVVLYYKYMVSKRLCLSLPKNIFLFSFIVFFLNILDYSLLMLLRNEVLDIRILSNSFFCTSAIYASFVILWRCFFGLSDQAMLTLNSEEYR